MAKIARARLDELLVERGLVPTRSAARGLIMAGEVLVDGRPLDKAGTMVPLAATLRLKERPRFVSRAGDKLAHALQVFALDVQAVSALDVGASTGGFTDCLLQAGAARVIALDVGRGQLDLKLRNDPRVIVLDKINARHLTSDMLPYRPDFLTMDVSFISVTKILPAVMPCLDTAWRGLVLIKPQFEAGPRRVGKGGIVRDPEVHREVLLTLGGFVLEKTEATLLGVTGSGLLGTDGNREFFFHLAGGREKGWGLDTLETAVDALLRAED